MQTIIRGEMSRTFYSTKEFERIEKRNKKRMERIKRNICLAEIRLDYAMKLKEKNEEIKNGNMR